jgi:hypothetical protein
MSRQTACRRARAAIGICALLGPLSCGGSKPTAPTPTPTGPLTITGGRSLGELHQVVQLTLLTGGLDATSSATWKSSDSTVAITGPGAGIVQAIGFGAVTVSATYRGQTATTTLSVIPDESCDVYDSTNVTLHQNPETPPSWSVAAPVPSFGGSLLFVAGDTLADANNLLALFQRYGQFCLIGHTDNNNRPNRVQYTFNYFKAPTGGQTTISPEDCVAYSPGALQVVDKGGDGSALVSNGTQLALLDTHFDAALLGSIAGQYSNECFIGRGNARQNPYVYITEYWK